MLIYVQFGVIQNYQTFPIPQTSFLTGTFFANSYSKAALTTRYVSYLWKYSPGLRGVPATTLGPPPCIFKARTVATSTTALGVRPEDRH